MFLASSWGTYISSQEFARKTTSQQGLLSAQKQNEASLHITESDLALIEDAARKNHGKPLDQWATQWSLDLQLRGAQLVRGVQSSIFWLPLWVNREDRSLMRPCKQVHCCKISHHGFRSDAQPPKCLHLCQSGGIGRREDPRRLALVSTNYTFEQLQSQDPCRNQTSNFVRAYSIPIMRSLLGRAS